MAHIVKIKILVDETNEAAIYDGLNEVLREASMEGPNNEAPLVVDWKFESVDGVSESVNDSIANDTYAEGDAFDANAHFIAPAPDLLSALEIAEDFMAGFEDDEMQEGMAEKLVVIRAAITKAKEPIGDEASRICDRLIDSEEHAVEAAIPQVAEDAVEVIQRLSSALHATQTTLSQAMQKAEKARKFAEQVAGLSVWGYDQDDGEPYQECEEPSDGYLDSHCCLMALIQQARDIQEGK